MLKIPSQGKPGVDGDGWLQARTRLRSRTAKGCPYQIFGKRPKPLSISFGGGPPSEIDQREPSTPPREGLRKNNVESGSARSLPRDKRPGSAEVEHRLSLLIPCEVRVARTCVNNSHVHAPFMRSRAAPSLGVALGASRRASSSVGKAAARTWHLKELRDVCQIAQHDFIRPRLNCVNTAIWVIGRRDEEHQQGDHRGEQHGQERLCQQTLNLEKVRRKN